MSDSDSNISDTFTETTRTGWLSRIGEAIKGVLIGLVLIVVAGVLLFWNEGRAVQTARSLAEGRGLVVDVDAAQVDPANQGKLVHVTGDLKTSGRTADPEFGVSTDGVRLVRRVEMYQWKEESRSETKKSLGGSEETTTTYTYTHAWSDARIDSGRFKHPDGHTNPEMRYRYLSVPAQNVSLGAFKPGANVLNQLTADQDIPVDQAAADKLKGRVSGGAHAADGTLYLGADPGRPRVGDLRITFQSAPQGPASIIAQQSGNTFAAYQTKAGDALLMVASGTVSADAMFKEAADENRILTWVLRLIGAVLIWIGFAMIFRPLVVVADVVPLIGDILGAGTGLAALVLTAVVAPVIIAIAWLWYRPLISIAALVIGFAVAFGFRTLARRKAAATPAPAKA